MGGVPLRVLRLSPGGVRLVRGWFGGAPLGGGEAERLLARRLLDAGLAHPDPAASTAVGELTVVVPVRDRVTELVRVLATVPRACPTIVVDDRSRDPVAIRAAGDAVGARTIRIGGRGGPSAARNAGLAAATTPFVAFVDSDCVLPAGALARLLAHLDDPAVAVAAPRIVAAEPPTDLLGAYEARHSALDMGHRPGLVAPGARVPYVPAATLVTRAAALGSGFDERIALGEDVDLVWRLHAVGWQTRYDPSVQVGHAHRARPWAWFTRRVAYNTSSAWLSRQHPGAVPALRLNGSALAFWTALALGRPRAAVGVTALGAVRLRSTLRGRVPRPAVTAVRLTASGRLQETRHLARALAGPWLPFLAVGTARGHAWRRGAWATVVIGTLLEDLDEQWAPRPARFLLPRAADDLARCLGTWIGCAKHRTLGPLRLRRG